MIPNPTLVLVTLLFDLNDLLPVEASVESRDHCVANGIGGAVPSNVQSEEIVSASKSSSYPAEESVT